MVKLPIRFMDEMSLNSLGRLFTCSTPTCKYISPRRMPLVPSVKIREGIFMMATPQPLTRPTTRPMRMAAFFASPLPKRWSRMTMASTKEATARFFREP